MDATSKSKAQMGPSENVDVGNKMDQKRGFQWLMNASEKELLLNKKQAIELVKTTTPGATANLTDYLWCNNSAATSDNPASGDLVEINFLAKFGNDSSTPPSLTSEDLIEPIQRKEGRKEDLIEPVQRKEGISSSVPASANVHGGLTQPFSLSWLQCQMPFYEHSFNKRGYLRAHANTYREGYKHFADVSDRYNNAIEAIAARPNHLVRPPPLVPLGHVVNNAERSAVAVGGSTPFNGSTRSALSLIRSQPGANVVPLGHVNNNERSMGTSGGFNSNNHREVGSSSSRVLSNDCANQPPKGTMWRDIIALAHENYEAALAAGEVGIVEKNEEEKKIWQGINNFPQDVNSLLSTGIFDGVPVKYVPWPIKKSLTGMIKGLGIMCSCESCAYSKCFTLHEFEIHAGYDTTYSNSNIYFPTGESIYAVFRKLKATPRDKLFDAVQNATGTTINDENFLKWKATFVADMAKGLGVKFAS